MNLTLKNNESFFVDVTSTYESFDAEWKGCVKTVLNSCVSKKRKKISEYDIVGIIFTNLITLKTNFRKHF